MNRFYLFISLLLLLIDSQGQQAITYQKDIPSALHFQRITKAALESDIQFWRKTMDESHVNLYHSISSADMDQLIVQLLAPIKDSVSHKDAVFIFSKLSAALNEGHLGLVSSKITDSLYLESTRFPYIIRKATKNAWVISYDVSTEQKLDASDQIIAINGISIENINEDFKQYFGGLETWKYEQIAYYGKKILFLKGIVAPFQIKALKENGQTIEFTTNGFTRAQADSINKALAARIGSTTSKPYEFRFIENRIGYLNYRSMRNNKAEPFDVFLSQTFKKLDDSSAKGLVIDLRENGGGDSQLGEMLLSYFNNKPYIFAGGMKWKISSHYKNFLKTTPNYNEADNRFYLNQKDGDTYIYINKELKKSIPKEPFFDGKVAFLIGTGTFSSANMLADGVVSYQLAKTFGEPTGESPNDFGEMFNFMLPNTYITARGSTKMFTRADKDEKNFGPVVPDVIVKPSNSDLKMKKDIILETAVNWLLNK